jgi:biotin operon repressor
MATLPPGTVATELLQTLNDGTPRFLSDLASQMERSRRQVSDAAAQLRTRGFLSLQSAGYYKLTNDGIDAALRGTAITSGPVKASGARRLVRNTFRERAWRSMRFRRQFTLSDVLIDATADDKNPHNNLARYVRYLMWAGYLEELSRRQVGTKPGSNGFKQYRLVKDSGRASPVYSAARKTLFDPNTQEEIPCQPTR